MSRRNVNAVGRRSHDGSVWEQWLFLAIILPLPIYLAWETARLTSPYSAAEGAIPLARMQIRLKFFTQRFRRSQSLWQFVLWLRQIALVLIVTFIPDGVIGAGSAAFVLAIALWVHIQCRPFRFKLINRVETGLLAVCVLILALACAYSSISLNTEGWVRGLLQVLLLIPLYFVALATIAGALWLSVKTSGNVWEEEEDVDWDDDEGISGESVYAPHDAL